MERKVRERRSIVPKVYCVTKYRNDISAAEKWGETVEMVESPISPFATDRMAYNIAPQLSEFKQEDYFLLTGPVAGYIIGSLILFEKYDWINVLRYNPLLSDYTHEVIRKPDVVQMESVFPPGRIFILNFIGHPIFAALDYANPVIKTADKIVTLTTGDIDQSDIENLTAKIASKLADFQGGKSGDLILLSGPAILNPILAAVMSAYGRETTSLLLYNPKRGEYHKREISLPHLKMISELALKEEVA
jgi:hypothetical protein